MIFRRPHIFQITLFLIVCCSQKIVAQDSVLNVIQIMSAVQFEDTSDTVNTVTFSVNDGSNTYEGTFTNLGVEKRAEFYARAGFNLVLKKDSIEFMVYNETQQCNSYNATIVFDSIYSDTNTLYIESLTFAEHYAYYADSIVCSGENNIELITDIPIEHLLAISSDGLEINSDGTVYPSESTAGFYEIDLGNDFCLSDSYENLNITIQSQSSLDLSDTLNYCSNSMNDLQEISDYTLEYINNDGSVSSPGADLISGYYIAYPNEEDNSVCPSSDTVYVKVVDAEDIYFEQEQLCEKTIVTASTASGKVASYSWSLGNETQSVEVTSSETISVEIVDANNCISSDTVYAEFIPFIIKSIDFDVKDSECWENGEVSISSIIANDNTTIDSYYLYNTINGAITKDVSDVSEGVYKIRANDVRNCEAEYDEEIVVLQNCLNNYPVFTPNDDGVEDTYFIPYEGEIKIFNRTGQLIRSITTPAYWDGKDSNGDILPMGNYVMTTDSGKTVNITIVR